MGTSNTYKQVHQVLPLQTNVAPCESLYIEKCQRKHSFQLVENKYQLILNFNYIDNLDDLTHNYLKNVHN